jgi:hypothetical protein
MTLEGLGEVFKGESADTCAGKFPLVSMGGRMDRQECADGERGPPSARAELLRLPLWIVRLPLQYGAFSSISEANSSIRENSSCISEASFSN